jgi:hypothetical protein
VLRLVDELELDADEIRSLRDELDTRKECLVDLAACTTEDDRQLALTIKKRIDASRRGETKMLTLAEANAFVRAELRRRRQAQPSPSRRRSTG